jgi:hypothetical protein
MGNFSGHFEGASMFLTPKLSLAALGSDFDFMRIRHPIKVMGISNCWLTDPPMLHRETSLLLCKPLPRLQDEPLRIQDEPQWLRIVSLYRPSLLTWIQIQIQVPKLMHIYADPDQQHCSRNDLYDLHIITAELKRGSTKV